MTLHMAPLGRNYLGGDFQPKPDSEMLFGLEPDHRWLGFAQKMSRGVYACGNVFDPRADFILKYAHRRLGLEHNGSWDAPGPAKKKAAGKPVAPATQ
jgi:hypothetical protein